jgi:hypothetical protein
MVVDGSGYGVVLTRIHCASTCLCQERISNPKIPTPQARIQFSRQSLSPLEKTFNCNKRFKHMEGEANSSFVT